MHPSGGRKEGGGSPELSTGPGQRQSRSAKSGGKNIIPEKYIIIVLRVRVQMRSSPSKKSNSVSSQLGMRISVIYMGGVKITTQLIQQGVPQQPRLFSRLHGRER